MDQILKDFLETEERLRNRNFSKRFLNWLESERGLVHAQKITASLKKSKNPQAGLKLLAMAQEAQKSDEVYKRQDHQRKKSLKSFRDAFEKWLRSESARFYREEIEAVGQKSFANPDDKSAAQELALSQAERAFGRAHPTFLPPDFQDAGKTIIRPTRYGFSEEIEDVVFNLIDPGLKQMGYATALTVRNWSQIVGPALAQNTRPVRTLYPPKSRTNGKLVVKVRNGFAPEIQHQTPLIVQRVNAYLGFAAIAEIHISKQMFTDVQTTGRKAMQRVVSTRIKPAETLAPEMEKLIGRVRDDEFREIFERFAKTMKARNG